MAGGSEVSGNAGRRFVVDAADLPEGDYVSPSLEAVMPDACFPHMKRGDPGAHPWLYLRREVPHGWYVDERHPLMGFVSRDEAAILYNLARNFRGLRALEIGCWRGWSTCHLGLGGVSLDVVDPVLADAAHRGEIEAMLACAGIADTVRLHAAASPGAIGSIADAGPPWSLFFIDGDHEAPGPERDVEACLPHAADAAAFFFHDLASPAVGAALRLLEGRGFTIMLYQTMQIMGIAWRGGVRPVHHIPDPSICWQLPHHLVGLPVCGVEFPGYPAALRTRLAEQARQIGLQQEEIASRDAHIDALRDQVRRASIRARLRRLVRLED